MTTQMHCFTNAGTRQQSEPYRAGKKLTNFVLEILNLQRKEDLTIDLVSNQDFSEVIYIRCLHIFIPQTLKTLQLAGSACMNVFGHMGDNPMMCLLDFRKWRNQ
jgi:hypothetical protein